MTSLGWGIKPIKSTTVPKSVITVSAQSFLDGDRTGYTEVWRCAVAHFKQEHKRRRQTDQYRPYQTPVALWSDVTAHCGYEGLTFLWVYDLNWTARVTDLFGCLTARGWELEAFSLNPGAPWMVWRRKGATLKVCDVASLWPGSFDIVARLFGLSRLDAPPEGVSDLKWYARARRDCEILTTAVHEYIRWIRDDDLGPLAVTGNGQAWKAFRRQFYTTGLLVHHDAEAREAERRAMWTGRCEAYWHGTINFAVVHEWDLVAAYTNIAAECDVPTFLHGALDPTRDLQSYLDDKRFIVLGEVDVETDTPVVPTAHADGIVWPVGRFRTTLWEPEIRALLGSGAVVHLRRGWLYRRSPALRSWARWVLSVLDSDDAVTPAWRKHIVKRWGNVLIGRFAMQYPRWVKAGESEVSTVGYWPLVDSDTGEESAIIQVGRTLWEQEGVQDAHDCVPAVTGYVMSEARARLWQLMNQVPKEALLYVDTDSLLVTDRWLPEMMALQSTELGRGLRLKRAWDGLSIYGPRQLVTGQAVRVAGLPKRATRVGRHQFEGETMEGLTEALGAGHAAVVHLVSKSWTLTGTDTRRIGRGVGWTRPVEVKTWGAANDLTETG